MYFIFTAPHLTAPTYETFVEYTKRKFQKIKRFLRPETTFEHEVNVTALKTGELFEIRVEVKMPNTIFISVKDRDLRRAIVVARDQITSRIKKHIDKKRV